MYVHGLGDAQERLAMDDYDEPYELAWRQAKKNIVCPCCKTNNSLDLDSHDVISSYFYEDDYELEIVFMIDCYEEECQDNDMFEVEYTY